MSQDLVSLEVVVHWVWGLSCGFEDFIDFLVWWTWGEVIKRSDIFGIKKGVRRGERGELVNQTKVLMGGRWMWVVALRRL